MTTPRRAPAGAQEARDERGMTLVELSVVMLIFSIVMVLIFGFLTSVQGSSTTVQSRQVAVGSAEIATQALSRQVHAAATPEGYTSPIVSASANELVLYAALGNSGGPTRLDIKTVAPTGCSPCSYANLVETITQPTVSGGVISYGTGTTSLIASGVVVPTPTTSGDCSTGASYVVGIFEYFDSSGTCLALSGTPAVLTSSQLTEVENLMITVTTLDPQRPQASPQTTVSLPVYLPNVDYAS